MGDSNSFCMNPAIADARITVVEPTLFTIRNSAGKELVLGFDGDVLTCSGDLAMDSAAKLFFQFVFQEVMEAKNQHTPSITKEEFEKRYAGRSNVTVEWLHQNNLHAVACECDESDCEGWCMARCSDGHVGVVVED